MHTDSKSGKTHWNMDCSTFALVLSEGRLIPPLFEVEHICQGSKTEV